MNTYTKVRFGEELYSKHVADIVGGTTVAVVGEARVEKPGGGTVLRYRIAEPEGWVTAGNFDAERLYRAKGGQEEQHKVRRGEDLQSKQTAVVAGGTVVSVVGEATVRVQGSKGSKGSKGSGGSQVG